MTSLTDKTAIVVQTSHGLGRGVTDAFLGVGAQVLAVARDTRSFATLSLCSPVLLPESADASNPLVVGRLLERYQPDVMAIVVGAPRLRRTMIAELPAKIFPKAATA